MKLWALIKRLSANLNTFWQSGDSNVDKWGFFSSKLKCQKVCNIYRYGEKVVQLKRWLSNTTTVVKTKNIFFYRKIGADFAGI